MGTQREVCYLTGMTLLCLEYCTLRMRSVPLDHNCIILLYTCGVVCAAKQFAAHTTLAIKCHSDI